LAQVRVKLLQGSCCYLRASVQIRLRPVAMAGEDGGDTNVAEAADAATVTFTVTLPGGKQYEVGLFSDDKVAALREQVEKQHEVPPACLLKLFQDGQLLLDADSLTGVDATQPIFGAISRDTNVQALLQAAGKYWGYTDILEGFEKDQADPKTFSSSSMPNILQVLEDMGGQAPDMKDLRKGEKDGTLEFGGARGDMILPSIDAAPFLTAAGADAFHSVTLIVEVNSDAYNYGLGVVLEASPLLDSTLDESGLPSYTYNGYGVDDKNKKQNAIKFHPGMSQGQLRIEGVGGWGNQRIGFTPQNWSESGKKYHTLELTVGADGENEMCIRGTNEGEVWRKPWKRQLTSGRHIPAVYAWLDLGSSQSHPLQIGSIRMKMKLP